MGQVSDFIRDVIRQHLDTHRIVVWYDPEGIYRSLLEEEWEGVQVLRYQGAYLRLRREADAALEAGSTSERLGETLPPVLIYLPMPRQDTQHALVELETTGVVLAPGARPDPRSDLPRDTSLAALAREALKAHLPVSVVEQVVADVAAGKLGLKDLDNLVRPPEVPFSLSTLYRAQTPEEITLAFLTDETQDQVLEKRGLLPDLETFLREHFGLSQIPSGNVTGLRRYVVAHLLITEAAVSSGTAEETVWQGLPVVTTAQARALAVNTVQRWRRDRNLAQAYRQWAHQVAEDIALPLTNLETEHLAPVETFPEVDNILLDRLADALADAVDDPAARERVRDLAQVRSRGFWPDYDPDLRRRWQALLHAGAVLDVAAAVQHTLRKGRAWQVEELILQYADRERGWYRLDQVYRHFEVSREALLDLPPHRAFTRLESAVRRSYRDAVHRMAERLVTTWERKGIEHVETVPLQRELFRQVVLPLLQEKQRVAYILVDALRYELLVELLAKGDSGDAFIRQHDLRPTLGSLPAITVLGMAALLPAAEGSLGLTEDRGQIVAEVDGRPLHTRDERIRFLEERLKAIKIQRFAHQKLENLRSISDRALEDLKQVDFLLVTSQEIDQVAENMSPTDAYDQFRRVFRDLWRALRRLADAGFAHVIVTADHGFLLFGDAVEEGDKVDPPAGETVKVGRRYWIGRDGARGRAYAYFTAADLGLTGGLEFAFPRGVSVFRAAGGHAHYYHGGISLQELVVPLLHIRLQAAGEEVRGRIVWYLEPAGDRVTSKLFRVTVRAEAQELFRPSQRVRLEVLVNNKPLVPQILANGCVYSEMLDVLTIEEPEPGMPYPPCQVTLVLSELPDSGTLELALVDADTGARLAGPISLPIDIAIR